MKKYICFLPKRTTIRLWTIWLNVTTTWTIFFIQLLFIVYYFQCFYSFHKIQVLHTFLLGVSYVITMLTNTIKKYLSEFLAFTLQENIWEKHYFLLWLETLNCFNVIKKTISWRNSTNVYFFPYKASFLKLPASHFCHQGLGWPCILVRSIIFQQLIMTSRLHISFSWFYQGQFYPGPREVNPIYSSYNT